MWTGGLAHAAHGAPARAAETGARRRGPVRDSATLKNGGRWTRVGTDPDAGLAPLGGAGKSAGRRRSRLRRRAAEAVRAARSKPSSAAVAGPRVLLAYAEHLPRAGRARGRGEATAGRRGPARGPRPARAANVNVGTSRAAEGRSWGYRRSFRRRGGADKKSGARRRPGRRRSSARAGPGACLGQRGATDGVAAARPVARAACGARRGRGGAGTAVPGGPRPASAREPRGGALAGRRPPGARGAAATRAARAAAPSGRTAPRDGCFGGRAGSVSESCLVCRSGPRPRVS